MATPKKTADAADVMKPVEDAFAAGKEQIEGIVKASNEAATKQYEQAVTMAKDQVEKTSKAVFEGPARVLRAAGRLRQAELRQGPGRERQGHRDGREGRQRGAGADPGPDQRDRREGPEAGRLSLGASARAWLTNARGPGVSPGPFVFGAVPFTRMPCPREAGKIGATGLHRLEMQALLGARARARPRYA